MSIEISNHTVISRNPNLVTNTIDNEVVMMSIENGEYYGLDEIGSRIWNLLETPQSFQYIIESLIVEYEVEPQQCEVDTKELVIQMVKKKLFLIQ